jgi:hypothetical protein
MTRIWRQFIRKSTTIEEDERNTIRASIHSEHANVRYSAIDTGNNLDIPNTVPALRSSVVNEEEDV